MGKVIDHIYTNTVPKASDAGKPGNYVIVAFAHQPASMDSYQHKPRTDSDNQKNEEKNALNGGDAPMFSDRKAP